jgi:predicted DNA-binding transcriptional regulator YafY
VHPLDLVAKGSVWYLVAGTDAGIRTFRVWRVQSVELTSEPVHQPPGFDLAQTWRAVVAEMDERRASMRVRALADPEIVGSLRGHLGTRMSIGDTAGDGRIALEIGFGATHNAAMELAGYSFGLEVLDPPEVRDQLGEIGRRLVERYVT